RWRRARSRLPALDPRGRTRRLPSYLLGARRGAALTRAPSTRRRRGTTAHHRRRTRPWGSALACSTSRSRSSAHPCTPPPPLIDNLRTDLGRVATTDAG